MLQSFHPFTNVLIAIYLTKRCSKHDHNSDTMQMVIIFTLVKIYLFYKNMNTTLTWCEKKMSCTVMVLKAQHSIFWTAAVTETKINRQCHTVKFVHWVVIKTNT